jgi:hypothetical protein
MQQTDLPTISAEQANGVLDDIVQSVLDLREEDGSDIVLSTVDKLKRVFGPGAQTVAQLVMLGAVRGYDLGLVEQRPVGDRTDIVIAALRRVHTPEAFGDCVEDGEHFPCKTARILNLVAGTPALDEEVPAAEERELTEVTDAWADIISGRPVLGMVRRDQLRAGDTAFSSHYGLRTVHDVIVQGETATIRWEANGRGGQMMTESYEADSRIPLSTSAE